MTSLIRKHVFLFYTILSLMVGLLFFLATEAILRITVYTHFERNDNLVTFIQNSTNPRLVFELKPYSEGFIYDKKVVINERGERGYLYPYNNSNTSIRIVFIGDSITFGFGSALNGSYPYLVEKKLQKYLSKKIESVNLGVYSYNTVQQVESLKEKGLKYSPDLVVMGFYISNPEGYYNRLNMTPPKGNWNRLIAFLSNKSLALTYFIRIIKKYNPNSAFPNIYNQSSENWKNFEAALTELQQMGKDHNFKVMIVIFPVLSDFKTYPLYEYYTIIKDLSEKHNFLAIDIFEDYKNYTPNDLKVAKQDNAHPTTLGNNIISNAIVNKIFKQGLLSNDPV